jgi:hypothetical protein
MRRAELVDGIRELLDALESSNLETVLADLIRGEEDRESVNARMLGALMSWSFRERGAPPASRHLVELFDLRDLNDPAAWSKLVSESGREYGGALYGRVEFVSRYLPRITRLLQSDVAVPPGRSELTVVLVESDQPLSGLDRVRKVLDSVDRLYQACRSVQGLGPDELSVAGMDSGGDKTFDFLGDSATIERVKEIIVSLWDRVAFIRGHRMSTRISLVAETLPVIEQVATLERDQKLLPEDAEALRRSVIEAVTLFLESGALIPEIDRPEQSPRPSVRALSRGA